MATARQLINDARNYDSIGSLIGAGVGGAFLALFVSGINVLQAIAGVLLLPLEAMGIQLGNVVTAFIGGGARIIEQGARTTIASIAPGATWAVGPLTFAFGIIAAAAGLYVMGRILALPFTSDTLPFSFTDIPFIGVDEDDEDTET